MTTTAPETVDLTAAANNGQPKRRGRPPGSKNKPKDTAEQATPKKRGRPRKNAATPARKPTARRVSVPQPSARPKAVENHAILIENDGLVVIGNDGSSYRLHAPVIVDRRNM